MRYLIYALIDPRTSETRYIGLSTKGLKRPAEHTSEVKYRNKKYLAGELSSLSHKEFWLMELFRSGNTYIIEIVEILGDPPLGEEIPWFKKLAERETYWIKLLREFGVPLTNNGDGGEGNVGMKWGEEQREKAKGRIPANLEDLKAGLWLGRKHTEETKRKMSRSSANKEASFETRAKIKEAKRGKGRGGSQSSETINKKSQSLKSTKNGIRPIKDNLNNCFSSVGEAAKFHHMSNASIWRTITLKRPSSGGLTFEYLEKIKQPIDEELVNMLKAIALIYGANR